jgi:formylmethanofuran dehydrogenase subunit D
MSKTTFFKRIALTAIAALGFGMLSVAPSQAVVQNLVVTGANGTANLSSVGGSSDSRTGATLSVTALLEASDSITVSFVEKSVPTGASAVARLYYNDSSTPLGFTTVDSVTAALGVNSVGTTVGINRFLAGTDTLTGVAASGDLLRIRNTTITTPGYIGANFELQLDSTSARIKGTYTYTIIVKTYNAQGTMNVPSSTTSTDVSIVVADTAANVALVSGTIDPSKTTAVMNAGAPTILSAVDSAVSVVATAESTNHATIQVKTYTSTSLAAPESVTVTITGPGLVTTSDGSIAGKSLTMIGTGGDTTFRIRADGTAGVASIVVKTTTVTFAAKTVNFYAKAAKTITALTNHPVIKVGSNAGAVVATAVDADGNNWTGTAYIYASTAADALIAGSNATPAACTYSSTLGAHLCPVTGTAKGTANLKVIDASTVALATATSNEVSTRVSTGVATTAKLSFDKATYAPGEKAQVRVQVLDEAGLAVPAMSITNAFTAAIAVSKGFSTSAAPAFGTTLTIEAATSTADDLNAGHQTYVVYMPMSSGVVTISATGSTGLALAGRVALSASATVVNNDPAIAAAQAASEAATDAAAEAIDAANAATDAANLAAEAADAATVAAEEARDAADAATAAVEALATEVATLMAALKAQITTLANTVAKIAKKVKA